MLTDCWTLCLPFKCLPWPCNPSSRLLCPHPDYPTKGFAVMIHSAQDVLLISDMQRWQSSLHHLHAHSTHQAHCTQDACLKLCIPTCLFKCEPPGVLCPVHGGHVCRWSRAKGKIVKSDNQIATSGITTHTHKHQRCNIDVTYVFMDAEGRERTGQFRDVVLASGTMLHSCRLSRLRRPCRPCRLCLVARRIIPWLIGGLDCLRFVRTSALVRNVAGEGVRACREARRARARPGRLLIFVAVHAARFSAQS